ncbi:nickel transporter [Paralimibaculum aggregatum]|uniref:Nickel/cobalt efflux system n=1 Tax=Paralimibaculum aggregatum TaxID=3036245 RepID=A0ABQ6LTU9_9RHOB|nr:hypothetical protein [Limibaculum sp. NKW23]GMG85496.1 nickel transporter [Limibaculum sp. NKW23]
MRVIASIAILAGLVLTAILLEDAAGIARWASGWQRTLQNEMASAVQALRSGAPGATIGLIAAAGAYGFVHAAGPGHGKFLIGGVGLGSSIAPARLVGLAVASSLAQALWAILLVYGGFLLLEAAVPRMTTLAENYLAPASYLAIAAIGAVLIWRGARRLAAHQRSQRRNRALHHHSACGCHAHGPSPDQVAAVRSTRDAIALIVSIAMRPCTGAIFLLIIAWQMEIAVAGAFAVVVMGLGTAALTSLVAVSSIAARGIALASVRESGDNALVFPVLQILAGVLIVSMSLALLGNVIS